MNSMQNQSNNVLPTIGNDAIEMLLNDHNVIKGLLERLAGSSADQDRRATLLRLKTALTIHNAMEETLIYPAIRVIGNHMMEAEQLYVQTSEADVHLWELDMMLKGGLQASDFTEKATSVRDAILAHIDKEENHAFRHLRENATPQQHQLLTEAAIKFRRSISIDLSAETSSAATG